MIRYLLNENDFQIEKALSEDVQLIILALQRD
jgi:hypothetical protein